MVSIYNEIQVFTVYTALGVIRAVCVAHLQLHDGYLHIFPYSMVPMPSAPFYLLYITVAPAILAERKDLRHKIFRELS